MKKIIFLLFIICSKINAQNDVNILINFETNSYNISDVNKTILNAEFQKIVAQLENKKKLQIIGYTDTDGNLALNSLLSNNRAKEVATYFIKKGIPENKISFKGENYKNPIADNSTDEGKSKNRRVTIKVVSKLNEDLSIYKFREKEPVYSFDANKEYSFTYKSGTKITIPESAFIDKNDKNIEGKITIKYEEYRNKLDFILSGIPMHIDTNDKREFFNSGGMFKINAFQNGEPIFLKPDKVIESDFVLTDAIPNLNLYGLDSLKGVWQNLAPITNNNGLIMTGRMECGYNEEKDTTKCVLNLCESLKLIQKVGIKYASDEMPLFNLANLTDPTSFQKIQQTIQNNTERIASNKNRINILATKFSKNKTTYQLIEKKSDKETTTFEISEFYDNKPNTAIFNKSKWEIATKNISKEMFSKSWKICFINEQKNENYSITLQDSMRKITLYDVNIALKKRVRKRKRQAFKADLVQNMNQKSVDYLINDSISKNLVKQNVTLEKNNKILVNYREGNYDAEKHQILKDSIYCFIQSSRQIMPQNERNMGKNEWLTYFDANRDLMLTRYTTMFEREDVKKCDEERQLRDIELKKIMEENRKFELANDKAISLIQRFSINTLGIYNCDQIILLQNPIELLANYQLKNGASIEPLFIFLLDEKVNGILRYDKNRNDFNPSRFALNPTSKNTLLVFDENGESYLFSYKDFRKLDMKDLTKQKTLVVKKIETKDQLKKEFL